MSVKRKFCCVGLCSAVTVGFSLTQLGQSTLKEMPSILAVELCPLLPWQDYSGEYLFWRAGHANCRPPLYAGREH